MAGLFPGMPNIDIVKAMKFAREYRVLAVVAVKQVEPNEGEIIAVFPALPSHEEYCKICSALELAYNKNKGGTNGPEGDSNSEK